MADFKERRFSIEPGKGKKMDGCPYSIYEDGHDVKDYIIPPKGYIFKGFRFDPDASNQIYDGKLIAIYEKETFNQKMMSQLWKFILAFAIIAVIAIIAILAAGVFKDPSPKPNRPANESTAVVESNEPAPVIVVDTTPAETEAVDTTSVSEESVETVNEVVEEQEETPQPVADDPNVPFKQAFWTLIHQRTILKNSTAFKEWTGKLQKIPASELETINTVNDLKNKLKEIE